MTGGIVLRGMGTVVMLVANRRFVGRLTVFCLIDQPNQKIWYIGSEGCKSIFRGFSGIDLLILGN